MRNQCDLQFILLSPAEPGKHDAVIRSWSSFSHGKQLVLYPVCCLQVSAVSIWRQILHVGRTCCWQTQGFCSSLRSGHITAACTPRLLVQISSQICFLGTFHREKNYLYLAATAAPGSDRALCSREVNPGSRAQKAPWGFFSSFIPRGGLNGFSFLSFAWKHQPAPKFLLHACWINGFSWP